ncbi:solute carrier organic anion transporter family member 4A1-like isoform X2 [Bolinopsis microptera]|uniref:solute carrier organic anion transporter family member 4A1-like isoform X2 n=1 Tax=Bolinopsis microptera TaxID=2820187 RepID=UPI00307917D5
MSSNKVKFSIDSSKVHHNRAAQDFSTDPEAPKMTYEVEEKDDRKTSQMGVFGWRPRFLECLNQPVIFVVFFGIGNLFTVMSFGVLSVYLTTLEKTFNLNSKETGVILLGNDISGLFASLILANYCSSKKIRWIAIGMFAVVLSCLLPAMATLFAEYPEMNKDAFVPSMEGIRGLCDLSEKGFGPPPQTDGSYAVRNHGLFWLFVAGSLVLGIGGSPPGIAGPTYMDEMYTQKEFGIAISLLYIITFVGFPISVLFAGASLDMYVTLDPPEGMNPSRPEWVGAWWLGFLVPAVVIFFVSFIVMLFPTQMPAAKRVLSDKIKKGITTAVEKKNELHRSILDITRDTIPVAKRILKNKSLNCLVFGDALVFLQIGSISYLPKMYAIAFRLGFSEVGTVIGVTNVVAFVLGLVLGGAIMRIKDWHPKKLLLIYAVAVLVSTPFTASLFYRCDSNTVGGVDIIYPNSNASTPAFLDTCNEDCKCNTVFPSFVCDTSDQTTYFSQCHAGCLGGELNDPADIKSGVKEYSECGCTAGKTVVPGECGSRCQTRLYISLTLSVIGTMINFSGYAAHATVYQRVVGEVDRTVAQGWRQFITRVLGTLPAPILFGYIIDNACTIWRTNFDGKQGNCWVYDLDSLLVWFVWVQIILRIGSSILYFAGWYLYPEPTQEELERYEGRAGSNGYEMERTDLKS